MKKLLLLASFLASIAYGTDRKILAPTGTMFVDGQAGVTVQDNGTSVIYVDNGKAGIGGVPGASDGRLHVTSGDSTQTPDANGDELVLENAAGPAGLSILTAAGQGQNIYFGDADDNNIGRILYDHGANTLGLYTNNAQAIFMESDQDVQISNGTLILSADVYTKIATVTSYTFNSATDTGIDLSEDGTYIITVRRDASGSSSIYLAASDGTTGTANIAGAKAFGDTAGTIGFTGNNLEWTSGHAGTENFTIRALRTE